MSRPALPDDAGFSLAETLVALFVVALLATSGGALLVTSLQASDRVRASTSTVSQMEVMNAMLRDDLAAMTRRGSTGTDGLTENTGFFGANGRSDGTVMSFVRGGWARLDPEAQFRSDLQRVVYRRQGDRLIRKNFAAPDPTPETEWAETVILTGIADLRLRYRFAGQWAEDWQPVRADPERRLVSAVEVAITFVNGDSLTQRFLVEPSA